jgi:hypothetical protein
MQPTRGFGEVRRMEPAAKFSAIAIGARTGSECNLCLLAIVLTSSKLDQSTVVIQNLTFAPPDSRKWLRISGLNSIETR